VGVLLFPRLVARLDISDAEKPCERSSLCGASSRTQSSPMRVRHLGNYLAVLVALLSIAIIAAGVLLAFHFIGG
jgi:hypothetical protein